MANKSIVWHQLSVQMSTDNNKMKLTIDADVDTRSKRHWRGDCPVGNIASVLHSIILLPRNDLQNTDCLRILVRGLAHVGRKREVTEATCPCDVRRGRASTWGAAKLIRLPLHSLHAGLGDGGGAGGQEDGEAHRDRVQLHPRTVLLDPTLKFSVISVVICVGQMEIISSFSWLMVHPEKMGCLSEISIFSEDRHHSSIHRVNNSKFSFNHQLHFGNRSLWGKLEDFFRWESLDHLYFVSNPSYRMYLSKLSPVLLLLNR